ncbi:MAG: magnesium chelatase [Chitinophagaceae bacterium]|nr:MAG: magnesium chelatase [Chitinophagaceae bacterium]
MSKKNLTTFLKKRYKTNEINTLGELKTAGYQYCSIKKELKNNLIEKIKKKETTFPGIVGFEDTVIPELERAILAGHNILLLGLRGQGKTKIARLMVDLLDEYIPVIQGSPLNEDPLLPISKQSVELITRLKDKTPVDWMHKTERYSEKLATPDVSIADLIGDIDPIKAVNQKLTYADEEIIHYGIIPRSNRCIFTINELPDLQARIQVSLFNILQEGDIQIRGFKLRMPLDIQFCFSANPEDYTSRGAIVTPLKDRIESQIITHYALSTEIAKNITAQEASIDNEVKQVVNLPEMAADLIEEIVFEARKSDFVDIQSGVSARLSISAYELLYQTAYRRALANNEKSTNIRLSDFAGIVPAITGKIELVYEGEQEGAIIVAHKIIEKAVRNRFNQYFPEFRSKKINSDKSSKFLNIIQWFENGNELEIDNISDDKTYKNSLAKVTGLMNAAKSICKEENHISFYAEFILNGLAANSRIHRDDYQGTYKFKDLLNAMFSKNNFEEDSEN